MAASPSREILLEVATFGETMLRLSPPAGFSLEQAQTLELSAGGTESNVVIALARLGHRAGWVSRLPANPLGRRIARDIAAHGVDTSRIVWAPEGKAGLIFIETGAAPRGNLVLYDRAHSAIAELKPEELPLDYLCGARLLYLTGVTPALSAGCRAAWIAAARAAKQAGRRVALDVNYRSKLWTPDAARETLEQVFPLCDLVFSSLGDAQTLFGMPRDAELAADSFRAAYRLPLAVLTLGGDGALAVGAGFTGALRHPVFPTDVVDRIGAGDAFAAGFLHGWFERDVAWGLRCGCALAALKQTYRGDATWSGPDDLAYLVAGGPADPHRVQR
jgi:2-dehydro-3-deoxygluconokinase